MSQIGAPQHNFGGRAEAVIEQSDAVKLGPKSDFMHYVSEFNVARAKSKAAASRDEGQYERNTA
jgi:hypothetical protein